MDKNQLLQTLLSVRPGLAKHKRASEESFLFLFTGDRVITYNDEIFVSAPLKLPVEGGVRSESLLELLRRLPEEDLEIFQKDGEMVVKGKNKSGGFRMQKECFTPVEELEPPKDFYPLPEQFKEALTFCSFSASSNMTKRALTSLHLTENHIESCDGFRMTRWKWKGWSEEVLLPARYAKALSTYELTKYGLKGGWIFFQGKGRILIACRREHENYPDLSKLLEIVEAKQVVFPMNLEEALGRVGVFTSEETSQEYVDIRIANPITVYGTGPFGWFEQDVPYEDYSGPTIEFKIEPDLMAEILTHTREAEVGKSSIKFTSDCFEHVVVVRI